MSEPNVAVLIDYENVGVDPLASLFDKMSDVGRVIVKRAYADWSKTTKKSQEQLQELGIEAIQNFHSGRAAKNSSDIRLAIDAVDLLHTAPVDLFLIASADSDFVPLVSRLRSGGKDVIGAGRRDVVSQTLVKSCDRYIYLEGATKAPAVSKMSIDEGVLGLLLRAVRASSDADGKVLGTKLRQSMGRIDPSFDFKSLGFDNFSQFLDSSRTVKISKQGRGKDIVVEAC